MSKTSKMAEQVLDIPITQGILAHIQGVARRRHVFSHANASCFRRVTSGLFRMAQLTGRTAWLIDGLHGWPRFVSKIKHLGTQELSTAHTPPDAG